MIGIARFWWKEIDKVKSKLTDARDMALMAEKKPWSQEIIVLLNDALDILKKGRVENEVHRVRAYGPDVENRRLEPHSRSQERRLGVQLNRDNGTSQNTSPVPRSDKEAE